MSDTPDDRIDAPEPSSENPASFFKVLVVDDITYVLKSISRVLRDEGFFVLTARTAREAIASYQTYGADLVTIDQKLPDMSGLELAKRIREIDRAGVTKIIFISSVYDKEEIRRILKQGVDDYLMKPFKKTRLIGTIKHVLNIVEEDIGSDE